MKIISRQYKKRERQRTIQHLALAILFLVFVGFLNMTGRNPFTGALYFISVPVLKTEDSFLQTVGNFLGTLKSKRTLLAENRELKAQLQDTEGLSLVNKTLTEENKSLKHLLGREVEDNSILAAVVSRPGTSPYDTFIIDVGARDGIHVGDEVIAHGDFLVGFVSKVFTNSSQATLYSSPGEKTNIRIGQSGVEAVATGRGAGNFSAALPRDIEVHEGDTITLQSFDTQIFGEVGSVVRKETDAFQVILFSSPVNVFTVKYLQVVRSQREL